MTIQGRQAQRKYRAYPLIPPPNQERCQPHFFVQTNQVSIKEETIQQTPVNSNQ